MKKVGHALRFGVLCGIIAGAALAQEGGGTVNLAPDPSFEVDPMVWQYSTWEPGGGARSRGEVAAAACRSGQRGLRVRGEHPENHGYWHARDLPVAAGRRAVMAVWVRPQLPLDGSYVHISVGFRDRDGTILAEPRRPFYQGWEWRDLRGCDDWVQVAFETRVPDGAVTAGLVLKLVGRGEVWFDDVLFALDDSWPVEPLPPSLARSTRLAVPANPAGEVTMAFTVTNPFASALRDLRLDLVHASLDGTTADAALLAALPAGASAALPVVVRFPGDRGARGVRLEFRAAGEIDGTATEATLLAWLDVGSALLIEAIREQRWGLLPTASPQPGDAACELLGVLIGGPSPRLVAAGDAVVWSDQAPPDGLVFRVAGVGGAAGACTLAVEVLDGFWRGETQESRLDLSPGQVHLVRMPISAAQAARLRASLVTGGAMVFRVRHKLRGATAVHSAGQRDLALRAAPAAAAALPALPETWEDVPPFGRLRLVDRVVCGDPADGHPFREGGKGLHTKGSSEPLDYYGQSTRLSYAWHHDYRDRRDAFSRIEDRLGEPCRSADDWGWFAYQVGRGQLVSGRNYVLAVRYPEDASRTFLVWNGIDSRASFGWHCGEALGDPFSRQRIMERQSLPLSGRFETWTALSRSHVSGSAWVSLHSMGRRADPFQEGIAVASVAVYDLGEAAALEALAVTAEEPSDAPRRLIGFIEEDAAPDAALVPSLSFLGLNLYAPLLLSYGGGTYATNSGVVRWPSELFSAVGPALRHPVARSRSRYFNVESDAAFRGVLERARESRSAVVPVLEYTGTGALPEEAFARWPDQTPHHFHWGTEVGPDGLSRPRYVKDGWGVDMSHPATALDCAALVREVAARYAPAWPEFAGVLLAPRFAAWQVSWSPAALEGFRRDTGITLPAGTAAEQAAWVQAEALDRFMAWHYQRKRALFLAAAAALREVRPDLRLWVLNYNSGDDNLPVAGTVLWFVDRERGDEFVIPGQVALPDTSRLDLVRLMEDYRRPEVAMATVGMDPTLYRQDAGLLNLAPVRYGFTSGNRDYLEAFRTGEGVAVCHWWIYNEDAYRNHAALGWNCPGLHGNEPAGPYCMMDEVRSLSTADPVVMGVRIGRMNRGFPAVAREFARAYRGLPAVPMAVVPGAVEHDEVTVRHARAGAAEYLAVIHTGLERAGATVRLRWPGLAAGARVRDLGRQVDLTADGDGLTLHLEPMSLRSLRLQAAPAGR
ncbi:MAG: hypothetical protein GX595_00560 [Lentisphaerae bacterium]|nr:hypothetical protein [Lentisphaerota bacterium]